MAVRSWCAPMDFHLFPPTPLASTISLLARGPEWTLASPMLPRDPSPSLAEDNFFFSTKSSRACRNSLFDRFVAPRRIPSFDELEMYAGIYCWYSDRIEFEFRRMWLRVNFRGQIRMQKVIGRSPPPPLLHNTVEIVITVSNLDCTTMRVQQAARLIGLQVR